MFGNPLLLADDGYQISRSVRLRSSASAYFNRTPGSAGNRRTWTWSGWVKRGALGGNNAGLLTALDSAGVRSGIMYESNNQLIVYNNNTTSARYQLAQIHRDPSAWYHIVVAYDTTQATSSDRIKVWVNSVLNSATSGTLTYPSQNYDGSINNTVAHNIGRDVLDNTYLDGYLTEINFIDGQALTPSSFGETDAITGVWKPKKYAGTYGTNGFFLNFSDNSSNTATTIGKDYSGNGNNWTPNNISVTAGVTYDSMLDVPTLWADGGNGRGNYAVLDQLIPPKTGGTTSRSITNGNLYGAATGGSGWSAVGATITAPSGSGKWYWEVNYITANDMVVGIHRPFTTTATFPDAIIGYTDGADVNGYSYQANGNKLNNGSTAYGSSYTAGDVIGVALDMSVAGSASITFYKNNVSQGVAFSGLTGDFFPAFSTTHAAVASINFGQRPFAYTPPTGFKALNTQNLPEPTIKKGNQFFDINLWTGNGSSQTITNAAGFAPDFVWVKERSSTSGHTLYDTLRGATKYLESNATAAEGTDANTLTAFNSNGFSVGSSAALNENTQTYVGWQWKEGATQGFDIVTYTGNGVAGRTISHSLGVTPAMTIVKDRSNGTNGWPVWHRAYAGTQTLYLESTTGLLTRDRVTAVSSTTFTVGSHTEVNNNGNTYVAYLFSEVAGFSRFGSYTGNGSADGPFVFCGFRPRFVFVKSTGAIGNWILHDTAREPDNPAATALLPNLSNAQSTNANQAIDILANGFKLRGSSGDVNTSSGIYIYAAFAENPFRNALAR